MQIRRAEIISALEKNCTGDWHYKLIQSSTVLVWDTIYRFPPAAMRLELYQSRNPSKSAATCYFFRLQETDTVLMSIFAVFSLDRDYRKNLNPKKDSIAFPSIIPLMFSDAHWFTITFLNLEDSAEIKNKLKAIGLKEIEIEISDVQLLQEEKDEPPPPPPPPPAKKKKKKQIIKGS
jgi:hypothetical protein